MTSYIRDPRLHGDERGRRPAHREKVRIRAAPMLLGSHELDYWIRSFTDGAPSRWRGSLRRCHFWWGSSRGRPAGTRIAARRLTDSVAAGPTELGHQVLVYPRASGDLQKNNAPDCAPNRRNTARKNTGNLSTFIPLHAAPRNSSVASSSHARK